MSDQETRLLRDLGISTATVAKALGLTRQAVGRGLSDRNRPYLTAEKLVLISSYIAHKNSQLDEVFRAAALRVLGETARIAFETRTPTTLSDNIEISARSRTGSVVKDGLIPARELWIFASQPRELERDGYLKLMRESYFDLGRNPSCKTERLVYFTSPQVSFALALQLLREFEDGIEKPNKVFVLESSALSICPRFVLVDPLPEAVEGWAIGESDDQLFKLAQPNIRHIVESVRSAGIVAFKPIITEDLSASAKLHPAAPSFRLAFDSTNLALSRTLLGLGTLTAVTPLLNHWR